MFLGSLYGEEYRPRSDCSLEAVWSGFIAFTSVIRSPLKCTWIYAADTIFRTKYWHVKGYLFYLAPKAINPSDRKADWLIRHDFVMANRTSSYIVVHYKSARVNTAITESYMILESGRHVMGDRTGSICHYKIMAN